MIWQACLGFILNTAKASDLDRLSSEISNAGANIIFLRDRNASDNELKCAAEIIQKYKSRQTKLVLNSLRYQDWFTDLADGWHLPENTILTPINNAHFLIGRSIHSVEAAQKATQDEMNYVIAGTMFETMSHPGKIPDGVQLLRKIKTACPALPVLAIGGITPGNAVQCLQAGASGIVVQSGIFSAKDRALATQNYRNALDEYQPDY